MNPTESDKEFLLSTLNDLLAIPSPTGYTDQIVHYVGEVLRSLNIPFELTRRGAIRVELMGQAENPKRAIVAHLDTLGAMVCGLKANGRLMITPIGTWSSRFAEGARVTIFTDQGPRRGTILPLKASGHVYNEEIDSQPVSWDHVELRVDDPCYSSEDLIASGYNVGDFIAIDPQPEVTKTGYINSRHLDNKAGVAALLTAARKYSKMKGTLPASCYLLFTISEEVGSGASAVLHGDIAEMVSVDNSTVAPWQSSSELGVTVCMKDSSGPFDYHLTQKLIRLCQKIEVEYTRDVFKYYRCDAASALEAGNDIRTALVCFGCDASHGYERTHIDSLVSLSRLLSAYIESEPTFERDRNELGSLEGFPTQPLPESHEEDLTKTVRPDRYKK